MTITSFIPEVLPVLDNTVDSSIQLALNGFPEAHSWKFAEGTNVPAGMSLTGSGMLTYKKKESPDGNYGITVQATLPSGQVMTHAY